MYAVSVQQGRFLKEVGYWGDNKWIWDLKWSRTLEGDLLVQCGELQQLISNYVPMRGRRDSWTWIKENDGRYSVSSGYDIIAGSKSEFEEDAFKVLWKIKGPSNAILVGWKVIIDRIQSKENLAKRNVPLTDLLCPLCSSETESSAHLFFSCVNSWQVWSLIANWLGLSLALPSNPKDHFFQFSSCSSPRFKSGLSLIWLAVVWHIWIGRNGRIFREEVFDVESVFELSRRKAWEWLRAKNPHFHHALYEWYREPFVCLADM